MIRRHLQVAPETVQNLEKLLPQVAAGLSQHAIQAAEARGQRRTLDDLAPDAR
jgi:hypothetical protein